MGDSRGVYMDDELADNSDDEKRMQKAEMRAGRKLKAAAAARQKKKNFSQYGPAKARDPTSLSPSGPSYQGYYSWKSGIRQPVPYKGFAPSAGWYRPTLPAGRGVGPCWHCGKEGHFRSKCPLLCGPAGKQ